MKGQREWLGDKVNGRDGEVNHAVHGYGGAP